MKLKNRIGRIVAVACITVSSAAAGSVVAEQPAHAASSYLWYNAGSTVFATQSIGGGGVFVYNGRGFQMYCYADGAWTNFHGNYWTNRYFRGIVYTPSGNFWAWVTASAVINQTSVGHC